MKFNFSLKPRLLQNCGSRFDNIFGEPHHAKTPAISRGCYFILTLGVSMI